MGQGFGWLVLHHPLTLSIALIWANMVFLWIGDLQSTERYLDRLFSFPEFHSLIPHLLVGHGFKGELAMRHGDASGSVEMLRTVLVKLHAAPYRLLNTEFHITLAQGLGAASQFAEGVALADEAIRLVEANGDACYMPELLRVKGGLLLSQPRPCMDEAEACFMHSLEISRR